MISSTFLEMISGVKGNITFSNHKLQFLFNLKRNMTIFYTPNWIKSDLKVHIARYTINYTNGVQNYYHYHLTLYDVHFIIVRLTSWSYKFIQAFSSWKTTRNRRCSMMKQSAYAVHYGAECVAFFFDPPQRWELALNRNVYKPISSNDLSPSDYAMGSCTKPFSKM